MALKDSWQEARQLRQQELAQRQHTVQQVLSDFKQARQIVTSQVQSSLSMFRLELTQQDQSRRVEFQAFQAELQTFRHALFADTQAFLWAAGDRRQIQAQQLSIDLARFVQTLQRQTAQLLIQATAEKAVIAEQVEALRSDVQSYLCEMEMLRQQRADQLHKTLQESREARAIEVQALFEQFTEFRESLSQFHRSLQATVWGTATTSMDLISSPKVSQEARVNDATAKSIPVRNPRSQAPEKRTAMKSSLPKSGPKSAAPASKSKALPTAIAPVSTSQPNLNQTLAYEKEVYNFLFETQGARLTQIESSLDINRFQAVDALRSLIKKGLITQRDRIYLVQTELIES